jgi:autotransporter translocation and assembly factor TamB
MRRRLWMCTGGVAMACVVLAALGLVGLSTDAGNDWIRTQVLMAAAPALPGGELHIERVDTNLIGHFDLVGVEIRSGGVALLRLERLGLSYRLLDLIGGRLRIDEVVLDGAALQLSMDEDGTLDLAKVFGPSADEPSEPFAGLPIDLSLGKFEILDASMVLDDGGDGVHIRRMDAQLGATIVGSTVKVSDLTIDVDLDAPVDQSMHLGGAFGLEAGVLSLDLNVIEFGGILAALSGEIDDVETQPDLDVQLWLKSVDPATVEALAGEPILKEPLIGTVVVQGPMGALSVSAEITGASGQGSLGLRFEANMDAEPLEWVVTLNPKAFSVDALTDLVPAPFVLNSHTEVRGVGTEYPGGLSAVIRSSGTDQVFAGEPVHAMEMQATLDNGVLELTSLVVDHDAVTLTVAGTVDLVASTAKLAIQSHVANASKLRRYGVEGFGGSVRFDGTVEAGWDPEVEADIKGELILNSVRTNDVSIAKGRGRIWASVRGEDAEGGGQLDLTGIVSEAAVIDAVSLSFGGQQSASGAISADATIGIGTILMEESRVKMAGLDGDISIAVSPSGRPKGSGVLNVAAVSIGPTYSMDGGPIKFSIDGDAVVVDADLRRQGAPFLVGQIIGDLAEGYWRVDGFEFALLASKGFSGEQAMEFRLSEGGAEDISIHLSNGDGLGRMSIEGSANPEAPDLHMVVHALDLSNVLNMAEQLVGPEAAKEALAELTGLTGTVSLDIVVAGGEGRYRASGWATVDNLVVPDQVQELDVRIDFEFGYESAMLKLVVGDEGQTLLWTKATADILQEDGAVSLNCEGSLRVRSMVPGMRFKQVAKRLPAIGNDLRGRASLDLLVNGTACNPDIRLVAAMDTPVGVNGERIRLDLEAIRTGDEVALVTTVEQGNRRFMKVWASLSTHLGAVMEAVLKDGAEVDLSNTDAWLDSFQANIALSNADLGQLARMADVGHPIEGTMGGGVHLSGTLDAPEAQVGIVVVNGRVGEAALRQFTVALTPVEQGYSLETILDFQGEGHFSMDGFIPLALRTDQDLDLDQRGLALRLSGEGIPLALGAGPTGLTDATGTVSIEGEVSGSLANPVPRLHIGASNAGFTLLPTALRYEPIEIDIDYTKEAMSIDQFKVTTTQLWGIVPRSGNMSLTGNVTFGEDGTLDLNLKTQMEQFWVSSTRQAEVATSGQITVKGAYPELSIRGDVSLDEGRITVGAEVLKDTSGFEVDPVVSIHRERREVVSQEREIEEESDFDHMSMDIGVDLGQALRLRADVPMSEDFGSQFSQLATLTVDLGLDGQLRVKQDEGILSVVGELQTLRGEAVALGKRFAIEEGTVTFTGEDYANPKLNLDASHQVGQYGSVKIAISGDVDNTAMELSSPEYPDQTDVMSMLLFGKPTDAMSETEGESGAGLLSAAIASVGGKAAKATGAAFLQNVQIDPGSGSVKVGFPLTDKIYLSIERVKPDTDTDNMTQAAVEWILSRQTYGELVTGDRGKTSGDLYWRWRF